MIYRFMCVYVLFLTSENWKDFLQSPHETTGYSQVDKISLHQSHLSLEKKCLKGCALDVNL